MKKIPPKFGQLMSGSFLSISGIVMALLGLAIAFVTWLFGSEQTVSLIWFVAVVAISIVIVSTLVKASLDAHSAAQHHLPTVRRVITEKTYRDVGAVLLLDPSELFVTDAMVSIYFREEEYEQLFGFGKVLTVQENGLIQVGMTHVVGGRQAILAGIISNDHAALKRLLVKPQVPVTLWRDLGEAK